MNRWNDFYTRDAYNMGVLAGFRASCAGALRVPDASECPFEQDTPAFDAWREGYGYSVQIEMRHRSLGLIDHDSL